jgi:serine/threonine-protein kinase
MTLYRLLHGEAWYARLPRPGELVEHGGFVDTLPWLPHVPKPWRRVIRKMMNDDRTKRYDSAAQAMDAVANLPIVPEWQTVVRADGVDWRLNCGDRVRHVTWTAHSPRRHEWRAWSTPVGRGRPKTLDGSEGIVSRRDAIRQLERYFDV